MPYDAATIRREKSRRANERTASTLGTASQPYAEYLAGKRVVIVGPAASLVGRGAGEEIDSYDVVVRMNLAVPVPEERRADVGSRADVLYHVFYSTNHLRDLGRAHTAEEVAGWREAGVRYVVTRHDEANDRVRRVRPLMGDLPLLHVAPRFKDQIRRATATNPNTGTLAIAHLLTFPIASLHVTGFDFYATGYYVGYGGFTEEQAAKGGGGDGGYPAWGQTNRTHVVHRQDGQMAYLRNLADADRRLTFDEVAGSRLGVIPPGDRITALVPMKGQSERVPGKNVRTLAGKPLLYWTLGALHQARRVSRVVVDTDSEQIAALVRKHYPQTDILMRAEHLRDASRVSGNDLIEWELSQVEGEHFGQFHVTSPLLTPGTVDRAVAAYLASDEHDSLMTVTEHHFWLFRADGSPVNSDTRHLVRSQDLEPLYEDNNAIHLFSRASFGATGSRIGERVQMFEIPKVEAIDIDYEDDFAIAAAVMEARLGARGKARRAGA
ncbi:MAG: glycosyltransferase family 29 protein [Dehalococcoidia bacterium]|nr:glycosyltransferase family 29 protein [Dehalococcoidia bacterium]